MWGRGGRRKKEAECGDDKHVVEGKNSPCWQVSFSGSHTKPLLLLPAGVTSIKFGRPGTAGPYCSAYCPNATRDPSLGSRNSRRMRRVEPDRQARIPAAAAGG